MRISYLTLIIYHTFYIWSLIIINGLIFQNADEVGSEVPRYFIYWIKSEVGAQS